MKTDKESRKKHQFHLQPDLEPELEWQHSVKIPSENAALQKEFSSRSVRTPLKRTPRLETTPI